MIEKIGNIFEQKDADAICFTSNGAVKNNGELVMGAGIAKAFNDYSPGIAKEFGSLVKIYGNNVYFVQCTKNKKEYFIFSFPTKHHWNAPSDLRLIEKSAYQLMEQTTKLGFRKVYLPKPGCGLGGLHWSKVKPVIENILDNRFTIIEY